MYIWLAIWNKNMWILDSHCKLGFAVLFSWGRVLLKPFSDTNIHKQTKSVASLHSVTGPHCRQGGEKVSNFRNWGRILEKIHTQLAPPDGCLNLGKAFIWTRKSIRKYGKVRCRALSIKNYYWILYWTKVCKVREM